jgi:hypothetical protein
MARCALARFPWVLVLACWLAACAPTAPGGVPPDSPTEQRLMLSAIKAYYENNAVEQNNACKSPLMDGVTRSDVVSRDGNQLVVQLRYKYSDYTNRRGARQSCSGFGERTFTLTKGQRFRVTDMTGEVRSSPSLRIW